MPVHSVLFLFLPNHPTLVIHHILPLMIVRVMFTMIASCLGLHTFYPRFSTCHIFCPFPHIPFIPTHSESFHTSTAFICYYLLLSSITALNSPKLFFFPSFFCTISHQLMSLATRSRYTPRHVAPLTLSVSCDVPRNVVLRLFAFPLAERFISCIHSMPLNLINCLCPLHTLG